MRSLPRSAKAPLGKAGPGGAGSPKPAPMGSCFGELRTRHEEVGRPRIPGAVPWFRQATPQPTPTGRSRLAGRSLRPGVGGGEGFPRGALEGSGISLRDASVEEGLEERAQRLGERPKVPSGGVAACQPSPARESRLSCSLSSRRGGAGPAESPDKLSWVSLPACREVFKAKHRKTGQKVALKKVLMENEKEGVSTGPVSRPASCQNTGLGIHLSASRSFVLRLGLYLVVLEMSILQGIWPLTEIF